LKLSLGVFNSYQLGANPYNAFTEKRFGEGQVPKINKYIAKNFAQFASRTLTTNELHEELTTSLPDVRTLHVGSIRTAMLLLIKEHSVRQLESRGQQNVYEFADTLQGFPPSNKPFSDSFYKRPRF
jgi:hypothetical protein